MLEGEEGAVEGAAGGIDAPLELAEGAGALGTDLAEGKVGVGFVEVLVGEIPELGFGGAEAAEGPLAGDEFIDEEAGFGGGRVVVAVIFGGEGFEIGAVFGGEDLGFGVDAGFEGVEGGGGFAGGGDGSGGLLGVAAVGVDLFLSRHGGS